MTIQERMDRQADEDKVYIGDLIQHHIGGEFGELIKCVAEGIKERKLADSETDPSIPPDRILGVIVGLTALQTELGFCVNEANRLKEEKREETEVKTEVKPENE